MMQYFVPWSQVPVPPFVAQPDRAAWGLLISTDADAAVVAPALRRAIVGGRSDLPYVRVRPYAQLLDPQARPWRLGTTLFALFAALALVVGAIGLYAAFTHAVAVRRREMAIRLAIGARPHAVVTMVLREALIVAGVGSVLGTGVALAGGRWLRSLLFQTSETDVSVLAGAALAMLIIAALATVLPARTASRSEPAALLR